MEALFAVAVDAAVFFFPPLLFLTFGLLKLLYVHSVFVRGFVAAPYVSFYFDY
ncbi:membrane-associated protein, putative [Bodo saltans]|uniref:Membrane-associated protein, putative n=1 Tax=Bodo saltans TaxID=75058 RepID=A0A0S4IYV9_BODSA|nr:membrane-associated protein, putative [Bodo saltans]|eukprot:CUG55918.1 membrane-associated protein, putative [Bodo saltans]